MANNEEMVMKVRAYDENKPSNEVELLEIVRKKAATIENYNGEFGIPIM